MQKKESSSRIPGCEVSIGSSKTLRGPNGEIVNGTIVQEDYCGYVVETPQGLMRVPHNY